MSGRKNQLPPKYDDGMMTGRYAYKSTLSKYGDKPCSWLEILPGYEDPISTWMVRDCNLDPQESWTNVRFNGTTLTARMKNAKGKVYNVTATVLSSKEAPDDLAEHYRSHLGEYTCDIAMFSDPDIQERLEALMGESSFSYLAYIFQTQFPIEYQKGMYWAGGFKAHECCDPAAVWAYDTYTKTFYVWVRKDGREYTWSETGTIPIKFQELYQAAF